MILIEEESDSDDKDQNKNLMQEVLIAKISDKFHTLKEAKKLPNWPEWEQVI
jgi:hypothetical protein